MKLMIAWAALALTILISGAGAQTATNRTDPLRPGAVGPDFTLTDTSGKPLTLSTLKQPTVLVFYRGYW